MGVYGLGRGVEAFFRGEDDAANQQYRDKIREQTDEDRTRRIRNEDLDRANNAQDRTRRIENEDYRLDIQKKNDIRTDDQNKIEDEQKSFARVLDMSVAEFNMSGDPKQLESLYNKRYPDGGEIQIAQNQDGTYNVIHTDANGKVSKEQGLSKEAIAAMAFGMRDPKQYMDYRNKIEAAKVKQTNEMSKLQREHSNNVELERIKSGGKAGAGSKEARKLVQQGLGVLQSHYGGKFEGGVWFPDDDNKDEGLAAQTIMESLVRNAGTDPVNAGYKAAAVSGKIFNIARRKAEERAQASGNDSPEQIEKETKLIANILVNKFMENQGGTPAAQPAQSTASEPSAGLSKPEENPKKPDAKITRPKKPVTGSGGNKPSKKSDLDAQVEKFRFKAPKSFKQGANEGGKAGLKRQRSVSALDKTVKKLSAKAKKMKGYSNLENMDKGDLKVALNDPDMSNSLKRAIVKILSKSDKTNS